MYSPVSHQPNIIGIYIHVPFCKRKCIYCDFYSVGNIEKYSDSFVKRVKTEWDARKGESDGMKSATLYIGGGTPSLLKPEVIKEFRDMIDIPVVEFTIEVNPDDVTEGKADGWLEGGVNRISMGVQSLDDSDLRMLGRRHDAAEVYRAYRILEERFDNINLDLMFGLPGQTVNSLHRNLMGFMELAPKHISAYSLTYEERTALTRMRDQGLLSEVEESDSVNMFRLINDTLSEYGYERYEISNYSLPGFKSLHNSSYWSGLPYIGLGPGAHSYDGRRRRRYNVSDIKLYLERDEYEEEYLSDSELREEMILTRLRTNDGLDMDIYKERFGEMEGSKLMDVATPYLRRGELEIQGNKLKLTSRGVMISDEIISDFF